MLKMVLLTLMATGIVTHNYSVFYGWGPYGWDSDTKKASSGSHTKKSKSKKANKKSHDDSWMGFAGCGANDWMQWAGAGSSTTNNAGKDLTLHGVASLQHRTLNTLTVNGVAQLDHINLKKLTVNGPAEITHTTVDKVTINGPLLAQKSSIQTIDADSDETALESSTVTTIKIRSSSATKAQKVKLTDTTVEGSITFENGKGQVILKGNSKVKGGVVGGTIVKN